MKQILATFPLRNFLRVFALVAVVSATSCSKDPAVDGELHGDMLRFAVAEADGWNTQLRCGAAGSEEKSAASPENVAEVFSLRGENPADTLFLHASVADGIAAPYPNVQTDRLQTRATPVETGTFYDSFGVLASVYTGTWSEDSCLPDYMYDVEVTEASSWTTSYYWPGAGRNIRFFAYAPYGGQGIVLSDKTSAGTPVDHLYGPDSRRRPAGFAGRCYLRDGRQYRCGGSVEFRSRAHCRTLHYGRRYDVRAHYENHAQGRLRFRFAYDGFRFVEWLRRYDRLFADTCGYCGRVCGPGDHSCRSDLHDVAADASVGRFDRVVYTDDLTSTTTNFNRLYRRRQWPMGRTVTYRISTSSIVITPTFTVMAPADFTYAGGSENYSVTSYAAVPVRAMLREPFRWPGPPNLSRMTAAGATT